ncbi:MAG: hypothetical protein AABW90_00525 [Nanoarchaeota archaeon]
MVKYVRYPFLCRVSEGFDIVSSYNLIEVEDSNGDYTKTIKDSKEEFEGGLKKNLERKIKETIKPKFHKSSKRK